MRIGVMLPNWVGDVAMATPMLRALRRKHPTAEIVGVGRKFLGSLFHGSNFLDRFVPLDRQGKGFLSTFQLVRTLRAERLDTMFVLRNSSFAAAAAFFSGAKERIGYGRRGSGFFLTKCLQPPRENGKFVPISAVDYYAGLAEAWDCEVGPRHLELKTTADDEAAANEQWARLGLPPGNEVILLNANSVFGSSKQWPQEQSVAWSRRVASELGVTVLVLCGPAERKEATQIVREANHPLVKTVAAEDVSFGVTKAIIRRSRMLISTDSGPRHLATALGTPTITLFGPIDPRWSRNYQTDAIELMLPLDCGPCGKKVCPLGHYKCMKDLSAGMVFNAVTKMLGQTEGRVASSGVASALAAGR
jgi:heptosyltransferase-2